MTMFDCACSCDFDDAPVIADTKIVIGRKDYVCVECKEQIPKGAKHEAYKTLFDGAWDCSRTCLRCMQIRDDFGCCVIGELYNELVECGWTRDEIG